MPSSFLRKRFHVSNSIFPWKPNMYGAQDFVPIESNLHSKLGINKGSKIHVFAGYYGNWAHALSEGSKRVRYTDASKEFTQIAMKKRSNKISYKTVPAELAPVRRNAFDWSFSFEPYPLFGHNGIGMVVTRSLLNRKGLKVLFSERAKGQEGDFFGKLKALGDVYGAKTKSELIGINTLKTSDKMRETSSFPRKNEFTMVTILTNPLSQEKAFFDLRVQNLVDKAIKRNNSNSYNRPSPLIGEKAIASKKRTQKRDFDFASTLVPLLSKQLKVSPKTVKESLVRLKQISEI